MQQTVIVDEPKLPEYVWLHNRSEFDYKQVIPATAPHPLPFELKAGDKVKLKRREAIRIRGHVPVFSSNEPPPKGLVGEKGPRPCLEIEVIPNKTQAANQQSKERVYVCPMCDAEFNDKDQVKACVRKHREDRTDDSNTGADKDKKSARGAKQ